MRLPEVIPPHQWRTTRLIWTNAPCPPAAGEGIIMDQSVLTVRVGGLDRTETIPLHQAYALPSPGPGTCSVSAGRETARRYGWSTVVL